MLAAVQHREALLGAEPGRERGLRRSAFGEPEPLHQHGRQAGRIRQREEIDVHRAGRVAVTDLVEHVEGEPGLAGPARPDDRDEAVRREGRGHPLPLALPPHERGERCGGRTLAAGVEQAGREPDEAAAVVLPGLAQQRCDVALDGADGEEEACSDLGVRGVLGQRPEDVELTGRKRSERAALHGIGSSSPRGPLHRPPRREGRWNRFRRWRDARRRGPACSSRWRGTGW